MHTMKPRSLNELRQTRDAVYHPPASHQQRMDARRIGDIYVIMDDEGQPSVACDDVACLIEARPEWSEAELNEHFKKGEDVYTAPNGEEVHHVRRKKQRM